jgi:hypothetical protein
MINDRHVDGQKGRVSVVAGAELACCSYWRTAFAGKRMDSRYYELVEDTIHQGFEYRYFVIENEQGEICAIQPFFLLDQDLVLGTGPKARALIGTIRRLWPRFLTMRMLMVGCVAGEGHLDGDQSSLTANARRLAGAIVKNARDLGASMIVLKEFPAQYREPLRCFPDHGFSRLPSLPMTQLSIDYRSFDDYMNKALNSATRRKLRKKFKAAAERFCARVEGCSIAQSWDRNAAREGSPRPPTSKIFPFWV